MARRDSAVVERACASFEGLMGYTDQVAQPEVARLCRATKQGRIPIHPGLAPGVR
jgi:hypothetical protein